MKVITDAIAVFHEAVRAVQPATLLKRHIQWVDGSLIIAGKTIPLSPHSNIHIIGAGKASAAMAAVVEEIIGPHITTGIVVTKKGHGLPLKKIKLIEAGHPVPDENSVRASKEILDLSKIFTPGDVVIFLLSGGASALLADYPEHSSLNELQQLSGLLLKCGATIQEVNTVRKHLSAIKGGYLAKAFYPARSFTLILSDVIGDPPDIIGSGPTVPDTGSFPDAMAVLEKYHLTDVVPANILSHLKRGCEGLVADTPKANDACFQLAEHCIIGNNQLALEAAAASASAMGYTTTIVTDSLSGEAKQTAARLVQYAIAYKGDTPACFLYGGETTVTVTANGLGGRNQEMALAAGILLKDHPGITFLSGGTDGTDGPTDAAGAVVNAELMKEITAQNLDAEIFLNNNDAYHFFEAVNGLIKTGPTQTNVMDIIIILVNRS